MVVLSAAELRQRFETGASDAALDDVIEAETSVIEARFGPDDSMVETFEFRRPGAEADYRQVRHALRVITRRPIVSVTSIAETVGDTTTLLAADDYQVIRHYQIERVYGGSNSRTTWGERVVVTYVPEDDAALRKQVLIKLCQLNLAENGYLIEKTPEYTLNAIEDYQAAREAVLRRLRKRVTFA